MPRFPLSFYFSEGLKGEHDNFCKPPLWTCTGLSNEDERDSNININIIIVVVRRRKRRGREDSVEKCVLATTLEGNGG